MKKRLHTATELPCSEEKGPFLLLENMYVTPKNFGVAPDDFTPTSGVFRAAFWRVQSVTKQLSKSKEVSMILRQADVCP